MELGGHAPVIVHEDADVALAAKVLGGAKFRNAGQVCISPTRFLVHERIAEAFTAALGALADQLVVQDGMAAGTQMGALANARRLDAMAAFTADALARGGRAVAGGHAIDGPGHFWRPTVLADVPLDARVFNEEPFGPLAVVRPYATLDDAIAEANRLPWGLAGYAFTNSLAAAHQLSEQVEVGMLWINQPATPFPDLPFGGLKDSGHGSEGGEEAFDAYLNVRTVATTMV
jgi:succinate-semialdehyde dehydrogenase/glutarate-semialdehyde dehydrogenase